MVETIAQTQRRIAVGEATLHCVEAGAGPPVILLHGFPEFWYSWRAQIPALAAAGFHALAPDLRGYNESDKPLGVKSYRIDTLVEDVAGLIREVGGRATLVGHDWGGVLAWHLAMQQPERVERLIILNAPHPATFRRELRKPAQWFRSSYILFFQLPWLPEWALARHNYGLFDDLFRNSPPGAVTEADIAQYKQALAQPGARTATLNYYRAALRYPSKIETRPIAVPTLLIWGEKDRYIGIGATRNLEPWVPNLRIERLPGVSHWVQNEAAETVNRLMVEFLTSTNP